MLRFVNKLPKTDIFGTKMKIQQVVGDFSLSNFWTCREVGKQQMVPVLWVCERLYHSPTRLNDNPKRHDFSSPAHERTELSG
jgi:hypothetical protein